MKILGVFTDMHGKLGNMVMQTWKGIQVARTHVIPANPRTASQTTNRTLLENLVLMFKSVVVPFVRIYWNPFVTSHQTGWGNLIGHNQKLQAGTAIDYELVEITKGSLPKEVFVTSTYDTMTGICICTWVDTGAAGGAGTDLAMYGVYNKDTHTWHFSTEGETRVGATDTVTIATGLTLTDLTGFLFFFTKNAVSDMVESCSDSVAQDLIAP